MKSFLLKIFLGLSICGIIILLFPNTLKTSKKELYTKHKNFTEYNYLNEAEERDEYYFRLLRDPATNSIPYHIREKELKFAKRINVKNKLLKTASIQSLQWKEAGPNEVGGRTRAIAVDINNSNTIIAGAASGGIWKSTDNGSTWKMKSRTDQVLSVMSIVQDPRQGHTNTWYYSGGELLGSASDMGNTANFSGNGIYKSTDNGETWNILPSTDDHDPTNYGQFDYTSRIIINPVTGSIFVASNGYGILRSQDGGNSFKLILGSPGAHIFSDVAVGSNGVLVASISSPYQGVTPQKNPGIYKSMDDGNSWTAITPTGFPTTNYRTVLALAPSNPNVLYVFTDTGQLDQNKHNLLKFYKVNVATGSSEDRSANLPDFTNLGNNYNQGFLDLQNDYNMILAVKPDDENFVLIGGSSLFRSTDGFATKPTDPVKDWIGGYNPVNFEYPNFHPDLHAVAFDPKDPNIVWFGNDGGIVYTSDITNTSYTDYFPWQIKNNGYDVTQFYMMAISPDANDNRIMGGCQDNGTPYFIFNGTIAGTSTDVSSGDGMWAFFEKDYAYSSVYNGKIIRLHYDQQNNPTWNSYTDIEPTQATNQMFIDPYVIDPNNENIIYYPAGNELWRNIALNTIPDGLSNGTDAGWTELTNLALSQGNLISYVTVSTTPANVLYYAGYNQSAAPKIYKLTNANTATNGAVDISVPNAPQGAYVNNIEVNPDNANDIIVVLSNYNIVGLYHSTDGGQSYTAIEGNLQGDKQNPGPSLRCANILPTNNGPVYFVATSIGLFSTTKLNGNNTQWTQEGSNIIGDVVCDYVTSRKSDGEVVVGTHGRGAFVGKVSETGGSGTPVLTLSENQLNINVKPGDSSNASFNIANNGTGTLSFSITQTGGPAKISGIFNNTLKNYLLTSNKFNTGKKNVKLIKTSFKYAGKKINSSISKTTGEDVLILDDGNDFPSGFTGSGPGSYFYWRNDFTVNQDFDLQYVRWYMSTGNQTTNPVEIAIEANTSLLYDTTIYVDTASNGTWYQYQLPQYILNSLQFHNGDSFSIIIGADNSNYIAPAAYDATGKVPGHSYYGYYYNTVYGLAFSGWSNLKDFPGFENAAWLIRAVGNSTSGGGNQLPVPVAIVSPNPANVNSNVTFDGSQSYDNDGQVVSYLWDFGDGSTSNQATTIHQYTQAGTFNYSLTVTDNQGGQAQATGQIQINQTGGGNQNPVAVAQVSPNPANVNSNVTFDGSQSYDNDGQVVSYLWDFGDGNTSAQEVANHQYSQAGNYKYSLTVTDNQGAQGQTTGQITVQSQNNNSRFTITPANGTISAGGEQNISVTFNAQGLAEGTYQAQLNITSNGGNSVLPVSINVSNNAAGVKTVNNSPKEFKLMQNYPNPFNPSTKISFSIPKECNVKIKVYNVLGQYIETLLNENKEPGSYRVSFNGSGLSSGIYLYKITAGRFMQTKKMMLLK